jgi:hypothetical protein
MSSSVKALLAFGMIVMVSVAWVGGTYVSVNNRDARLRNLAKNTERNCEQVFAQGWLKVKGVANVNKAQEEALEKVYRTAMEARNGGGKGSWASALTEAKIDIPTETYTKVMSAIEEFRNKFEMEQTKLLNVQNEHDNLRTTFPATLFLSNATPIEVKIISSAAAKEAYATGEDNNSDPYKE